MPDLAFLTLGGEGIALIISKFALTGRGHELQHVCLMDVSEFEAWLDEMVAGVKIAVVLQSRSVAAGRGVEAQQMAAKESLQRYVEKLHENLAHIVAYPFLEYIHEEASVLFGTDRALGD